LNLFLVRPEFVATHSNSHFDYPQTPRPPFPRRLRRPEAKSLAAHVDSVRILNLVQDRLITSPPHSTVASFIGGGDGDKQNDLKLFTTKITKLFEALCLCG
jgi:hypothetical protein